MTRARRSSAWKLLAGGALARASDGTYFNSSVPSSAWIWDSIERSARTSGSTMSSLPLHRAFQLSLEQDSAPDAAARVRRRPEKAFVCNAITKDLPRSESTTYVVRRGRLPFQLSLHAEQYGGLLSMMTSTVRWHAQNCGLQSMVACTVRRLVVRKVWRLAQGAARPCGADDHLARRIA